MADPTSLISGVAGTLSSSISIVSFINDVKNAPGDVETCFALIQRVSTDLEHLILLRNQNHKFLREDPTSTTRIGGIISSARNSILDICQVLEGCRKEIYQDQRIPLRQKMHWVLGDSAAFTRRSLNLQQQHAAINTEITFLRQVQVLKPLERTVTMTFENIHLLSMRERRGKEKDRGVASAAGVSDGTFSPVAERIVETIGNEGCKEKKKVVALAPTLSQHHSVPRKPLQTQNQKPIVEGNEDSAGVEDPGNINESDDDLEAEFYRDLRRQEEERHKRLAARKALKG
ncbi:hypothetical protein ACMFMG_011360 [Clarireedia jacksonii]